MQAPPRVTRLNLLYHIFADRRNDCWKWNVEHILKRWELFNGQRVLAIAEDQNSCSIEEVCSFIGEKRSSECVILSLKNNPLLREVASFRHLLKVVRSTDPSEASFYAHTKGNTTAKPGDAVTIWTQGMYRHLLDQVEIVRDLLRTYLFVGCHKMVWQNNPRLNPFPTRYTPQGKSRDNGWMLSGTFYWFSHRIYERPESLRVDPDRYAAEGWPWSVAEEWEAASLLQPWPVDWYALKRSSPVSLGRIPSPYDLSTYESTPLFQEKLGPNESVPGLVPISPRRQKRRVGR